MEKDLKDFYLYYRDNLEKLLNIEELCYTVIKFNLVLYEREYNTDRENFKFKYDNPNYQRLKRLNRTFEKTPKFKIDYSNENINKLATFLKDNIVMLFRIHTEDFKEICEKVKNLMEEYSKGKGDLNYVDHLKEFLEGQKKEFIGQKNFENLQFDLE